MCCTVAFYSTLLGRREGIRRVLLCMLVNIMDGPFKQPSYIAFGRLCQMAIPSEDLHPPHPLLHLYQEFIMNSRLYIHCISYYPLLKFHQMCGFDNLVTM